MIGIAGWLIFGGFEITPYVQMWLVGVISIALLNPGLSLLLAAGQTTRRRAAVIGGGLAILCLALFATSLNANLYGDTNVLVDSLNPALAILRYFLPVSGNGVTVSMLSSGSASQDVGLAILAGVVEAVGSSHCVVVVDALAGKPRVGNMAMRQVELLQLIGMMRYEFWMHWRRRGLLILMWGMLIVVVISLLVAGNGLTQLSSQQTDPTWARELVTSALIMTIWSPIGLGLAFVLPLIAADPAWDRQYGVRELLDTLPISSRLYLLGASCSACGRRR